MPTTRESPGLPRTSRPGVARAGAWLGVAPCVAACVSACLADGTGGPLPSPPCRSEEWMQGCLLPVKVGCSPWFVDGTLTSGLVSSCPDPMGHAAAPGDVDADGDVDLVVSCAATDVVSVWRNDGAGRFTKDVPDPPLPPAFMLALVDLDGDGALDLVGGDDRLRVLANDGTGTFTPLWEEPAADHRGRVVRSIQPGDFDGDGRLDLAVGDEPRVLLARAEGGFDVVPVRVPVLQFGWVWGMALLPFDDASPLGLYVGNDTDVVDRGGASLPYVDGWHDLLVTFSRDEGGAVTQEDRTAALGPPVSRSSMGVVAADFNEDGLLDLWFSNIGRRHLFLRTAGGKYVESSESLGLDTAFVAGVECDASGGRQCLYSSWSALRQDFDADGFHDLVVATTGAPTIGFSHRGGSEYVRTEAPLGCRNARALVADDFDGDGRLDVFATHFQDTDRLFLGKRDGTRPGRLVRFAGRAPNTGAIGARGAIVRASGRREPFLVGEGGRVLTYGPAPLQVVDRPGDPAVSLSVRWPDGTTTEQPFDPAGTGPLVVRQPAD